MTTATFDRAIRVRRSETGCYTFASTEDQDFDDAIDFRGDRYEWEIIGTLTGWGDWTHVVRVDFGPEQYFYFVR
jgi:hypothetical protein